MTRRLLCGIIGPRSANSLVETLLGNGEDVLGCGWLAPDVLEFGELKEAFLSDEISVSWSEFTNSSNE